MPLDVETRAFLERANARSGNIHDSFSVEEFRAAGEALRALSFDAEELAEIRDISIPVAGGRDISVRLYRPDVEGSPPLIVGVHGGSWVRMSVSLQDEYYRALANRSGCVVAAVEYRLAPESRFPTAIEEVHAAASWLQQHATALSCDANRFAILGESSGGNLAAAATLMARERGDVSYSRQFLLVPLLDLRLESPSWEEFGTGYLLGKPQLRWALEQYAPGVEVSHPLLSPLCADSHIGLPAALIFTGEYDPLRDDGARYAVALQQAGVRVRYWEVPGLVHPAVLVPKAIPSAALFFEKFGAMVGAELASIERVS
ncbi:alpha/beta hydrolase [Nocardia sp. SC052]|uniref:alpha/beta hydrolase n=1 Tax=Nocardia sichangensis TaxID=3385975 RepID=UPI0039A1665C